MKKSRPSPRRAAPPAPAPTAATPARRTAWWERDRFGMFIHWGLYAIPARGEWVRSVEKIPDAAYQPFFDEFDPVRYDPRAWARLAKAAGMKYAVMTAKHHDGFCLFDSALTDFKSTNTPARRDLVREYLEAFRAEGLKAGLYYSLIDWHHPDYPVADRHHPMREDREFRERPRDFNRYLDYFHGQVRELLTGYGPIDILWFDFSYDDMHGEKWRAHELMKMVRRHQPRVIVDNRLDLHHQEKVTLDLGDFASPEQIIPASGVVDPQDRPVPWEACITLNRNWGYHSADRDYKSARDVVHMLIECVSKGGNLLLNVGPNARGEIPRESAAVLERVGAWMRDHGESIYGCGPAALPKPEWGRYTQKDGKLYAHVLNPPIGAVGFPGQLENFARARLLADGSEVKLQVPWNAWDRPKDAFLTPPRYDEFATVVEIALKS